MGFKLKRGERAEESLQRILIEEIDGAIVLSAKPQKDPVETVHEIRTRLKKVRAVLRLLRDAIGNKRYDFENAFFRDMGHQLSDARDAEILAEAFDKLEENASHKVVRHAVGLALSEQRDAMNALIAAKQVLPNLKVGFEAARDRIAGWSQLENGWQSLEAGVRRSYSRGRDAFDKACSRQTFANFHEWRKRVKELNYDIRILKPLWPQALSLLANTTHELSDLLGDDHDFGVLEQYLRQRAESFGGLSKLKPLLDRIATRQYDLRSQAKSLGEGIYIEKPRAYVSRFDALWQTWS